MADDATSETRLETETKAAAETKGGSAAWLDLLKAFAIPLVTLV